MLLRGVNVGGKGLLPMAALRERLGEAGFGNVATYIQSGNVALDAPAGVDTTLAGDIEALLAEHFGLSVAVIVRRHDELVAVVAGCPFANRLDQAAKVGVGFANVALPEITPRPGSVDELVVRGRHVYLFCPDGFGRSKLPNLDQAARAPITVRNWNTVLKLVSMTSGA